MDSKEAQADGPAEQSGAVEFEAKQGKKEEDREEGAQKRRDSPVSNSELISYPTAMPSKPASPTFHHMNSGSLADVDKYKCTFPLSDFLTALVCGAINQSNVGKEKGGGKFRTRESLRVRNRRETQSESYNDLSTENEDDDDYEEFAKREQDKEQSVYFAPCLLPTGVIEDYPNEHIESEIANVIQLEALPIAFFDQVSFISCQLPFTNFPSSLWESCSRFALLNV